MSNTTPKPKVATQHSVILRPLPGSRFTIWGADVHLEFTKGEAKKQLDWLTNWMVNYIKPIADKEEAEAEALAEAAGDDFAAQGLDEKGSDDPPAPEVYTGQKPVPVSALTFLKEANGARQGAFRPEDYQPKE